MLMRYMVTVLPWKQVLHFIGAVLSPIPVKTRQVYNFAQRPRTINQTASGCTAERECVRIWGRGVVLGSQPLLGINIFARDSQTRCRMPHWSQQLQAPPVIRALHSRPTAFVLQLQRKRNWRMIALCAAPCNKMVEWTSSLILHDRLQSSASQLLICAHPRRVKSLCEIHFNRKNINNNSPLNLQCIQDWNWYC